MDVWFSLRGVHRIQIRFWIAPFAAPDWPRRFPRFCSGLYQQANYYDSVVAAAFLTHGGDPGARTGADIHRALSQAFNMFCFEPQYPPLDEQLRLRCLIRLFTGVLETFDPRDDYSFPARDGPEYQHRAPLPERAALLRPDLDRDAISVYSNEEEPPPLRGRGRARGRPRGRGCVAGRGRGQGRARR